MGPFIIRNESLANSCVYILRASWALLGPARDRSTLSSVDSDVLKAAQYWPRLQSAAKHVVLSACTRTHTCFSGNFSQLQLWHILFLHRPTASQEVVSWAKANWQDSKGPRTLCLWSQDHSLELGAGLLPHRPHSHVFQAGRGLGEMPQRRESGMGSCNMQEQDQGAALGPCTLYANPELLGWPKYSFRFLHKIVWKNPNELFGQPNTLWRKESPCEKWWNLSLSV